MGSKTFILLIIITFILTGSMTTICLKWSGLTKVEGSDGKEYKFNHPFLQATMMFTGEFYCLWVFYICYFGFKCWKPELVDTNFITKGSRKFNCFILAPASLLDLTANTINFVGLTMTHASSFQMFRGAIIFFVGVFSVIFLGRRLTVAEIIGMILVMGGLAIVGMVDLFITGEDKNVNPLDAIIGDLMILFAQIFGAGHMVYEQNFCSTLDIPAMQAAGLEGVFGLIFTGILNTIYYFIYVGPKLGAGNPRHVLEDIPEAVYQMNQEPFIYCIFFFYTTSTCIYNFTGITISKEINALTRKVVDSFRTIIIWFVAIQCFNQSFIWQTINGFLVLIFGLFMYSKLSLFGQVRRKRAAVPGLED